MFGKKQHQEFEERLDSLGRELVRASARNDEEAEAVASSPFLYTRVSARIAAERARLEEGEGWLAMLGVVWRVVPAMALVAIFAFALFWTTSLSSPAAIASFSDEALLGERDAGVEQVVFADRQPLSSDEVLATILSGEDAEVSR